MKHTVVVVVRHFQFTFSIIDGTTENSILMELAGTMLIRLSRNMMIILCDKGRTCIYSTAHRIFLGDKNSNRF